MRGLEKNRMGRGQTDGHVNSLTNSAQRAELVKNLLVLYIQPGKILLKRFFQMIFLAVLSENTAQCTQNIIFMSFIYLHFFNCIFFFYFLFN